MTRQINKIRENAIQKLRQDKDQANKSGRFSTANRIGSDIQRIIIAIEDSEKV